MYAELSSPGGRALPAGTSSPTQYGDAQETATATSGDDRATPYRGPIRGPGRRRSVPVDASTRTPSGRSPAASCCRSTATRSPGPPTSSFPGSGRASAWSATPSVPKRAPILARDGTPLAEGPATRAVLAARAPPPRASPGRSARPSPSRTRELASSGSRPGAPTGDQRPRAGLQPAPRRTARRPAASPSRPAARRPSAGGACSRPASRSPGSRSTRRSTPTSSRRRWPRSASTYGGVAVLDARNGSVLALAGLAFSAPQPPGSTFKIITTTAALEAGVVKLTRPVPDPDLDTTVDGRRDRQRPRRGLRRNLRPRRSPSRATASSRRSGPRSGRSGWSTPPSATASTPRRPSTTESAVNAAGIPAEHDARRSIPSDLDLGGHRDRPGRGARDPARDGVGRPDDRQRRRARARRRS